jgi:hypothetical protein
MVGTYVIVPVARTHVAQYSAENSEVHSKILMPVIIVVLCVAGQTLAENSPA